MKSKTTIGIVIGLILAFSIFLYLKNDNKYDWSSRLLYDSKKDQPYDKDIFIKLLKNSLPGESDFIELSEPFSKYDIESAYESLYVFIGNSFSADKKQSDAIFDLVAKGGTAFITSTNFSKNFLDKFISHSFEDQFNVNDFIQGFTSDSTFQLSLEIDGVDKFYPINYSKARFYHPYKSFHPLLDEHSQASYNIEHVGYFDTTKVNMIRIKIGRGELYLHSMPTIFGNYNLKNRAIFDYMNAVFKVMNYSTIYWDELQFSDNFTPMVDRKSMFEEIFRNKALRRAFFLTIFFILTFIIINAKRRVAPIPIINPVKNTSITFSKIISRLYWLNPNHKKMGEMKMRIFLSEIRKRYGISTSVIDNSFKKVLSDKSGIDYRKIDKLVDTYKIIKKSESIHETLLIQLNNLIYFVKQHWK